MPGKGSTHQARMKVVPEDQTNCQFFLHQVHGDLKFSIPRTQISEYVSLIHHEYTLHPLGPAYIPPTSLKMIKMQQVAKEEHH
jgi:hypothetical protein